MITTVTTVTTVTTITALGLTAAITMAAVITLIFFLATRELAGARASGTSSRIAKFVNIAIVPLVITFAVIVGVNIALVL